MVSSEGLSGRGGIQRSIQYFLAFLLDNPATDIEVHVLRTRLGTSGLVRHLTTPWQLVAAAASIVFGKYDVVHVNLAPRGSTFRKTILCSLIRSFGVRYILHLHGSGYDAYYAASPKILQKVIRRMFQRACAVVVIGRFWERFAVDELGVHPSRLHLVYNGVPSLALSSSPAPTVVEKIRLVTIGALGERKGTDILLTALSMLPEDIAWEITIAGDGQVDRFRKQSVTLGIEDRVQFPGWIDSPDEIARVLGRADVFVLPSRFENAPIAILEAMSVGLPVIATTVGAIPEEVEDEVTGVLVAPNEPAELAAAIERLARGRQLRMQMGRAGRKAYERDFSITAYAEKVLSLYRSQAKH